VLTYRTLDEVLAFIAGRDRPLGLYFFTRDKAIEERILYGTISGGVTINNCVFHVAQHDLPFGGSGASGMGHYHGREGFLEFSKLRPVFTNPRLSLLHLFYPPYSRRHTRLVKLLLALKR
jgi:coniferyl-aldehyde dehydrogenase